MSGALYIFVATPYLNYLSTRVSPLLLLGKFPCHADVDEAGGARRQQCAADRIGLRCCQQFAITARRTKNIAVLWGFTLSCFGAAPTLLRSMMADLTDHDELRSGENRAALLLTSSRPINLARR